MAEKEIKIGFPETKMEALEFFLRENDTTVEKVLKEHLDKTYEKSVPQQVRKFVESKMTASAEDAGQSEDSSQRQTRGQGRRGTRQNTAKRPPIMIDMMDACHLDFSRKHLENDNPAPGGISPLLDMFIITNRMNNNGAIYMFDDETMQRVAGKLGDNLIILPSSVHETIVYSEECGPDIRRAKDMVQAVNQTELREEDFLSGEIYRYDKDSHTLSKVQVPEHEEIFMPDKVSMEEMHAYGYVWDGMLPLTKERALELMDTDLLLFKLYEDGAEGMIETKEEILSHDGLFGVERDSWMNYLNAQSQNETNGMTLEM